MNGIDLYSFWGYNMNICENSIIILSAVIWIYCDTSIFKIELVPDDFNLEVGISLKCYYNWVIEIYENFSSNLCIGDLYLKKLSNYNALDWFQNIGNFQTCIFIQWWNLWWWMENNYIVSGNLFCHMFTVLCSSCE